MSLHILGAALVGLTRVAEGLECLSRAIALEPSNDSLRLKLGIALSFVGRHDEAAQCFRAVLAAFPKHAPTHVYLGLIHHQAGDFERAETCYRRALSIDANMQRALDCLAAAQARLFFGGGAGLQGAHAPARQVFLSAAVYALRDQPEPLRILEIGSYMGASALTWAHALDRLTPKGGTLLCVDPWAPASDYISNEMNSMLTHRDGAFEAFKRNIATAPRSATIEYRRGFAHDILPALPPGSFDLLYVDGSHYLEDVRRDIREADRVLRVGGFLCGDDLELQANECDASSARQNARTDTIIDPLSGRMFHPGVTIAVAEFLGQVSTYDGFWIMRKGESGYGPVDLRRCEGILPPHWPARHIDALRARFQHSAELRRVHG